VLAPRPLFVALARAAVAPDVNCAVHCQGCHLADGRATPGLVPALDGSIGRFMRVRAGRDYLVRLPNVAATQLDDADTAALLNWLVRHFAASELPEDF
jgi:mono/diheme cytochrome c family protein